MSKPIKIFKNGALKNNKEIRDRFNAEVEKLLDI
jgi:hypothetical protein